MLMERKRTFQGYAIANNSSSMGSIEMFGLSKSFLRLYVEIYRDKVHFFTFMLGEKLKKKNN